MNKDIISGKWTQLKGKAQAKWGDLTDDVFDVRQGDSKYLAGKLQETVRLGSRARRARGRRFRQHAELTAIAQHACHRTSEPAMPARFLCGACASLATAQRCDHGGSATNPCGNARGDCAIGQRCHSGRGRMPSATSRAGAS